MNNVKHGRDNARQECVDHSNNMYTLNHMMPTIITAPGNAHNSRHVIQQAALQA